MENQGEITYAEVKEIIGKTGKQPPLILAHISGSRESCTAVSLGPVDLIFKIFSYLNLIVCRIKRRYHSGESCVHERLQEKLGQKRQGSREKGRHPRSPRIRKRSQKTQMSVRRRRLARPPATCNPLSSAYIVCCLQIISCSLLIIIYSSYYYNPLFILNSLVSSYISLITHSIINQLSNQLKIYHFKYHLQSLV